ncbi:MAG: gliding motility-associated C-terminal domain-containing protein [Bacteroidales bacterium]|nr:gliding motility-associated C-terminal domain-containing protein [Bacteroidales bacterium]
MKKVRIIIIVLLGMLYQVCDSQIYIFGWPNPSDPNYTCYNGVAVLIIMGGQPRTTPGTYYTVTKTSAAGVMETTGNIGNYGIVTITGLNAGQTYSIHVTDGLGNSKDFSGTYTECTCQSVNFCRWTGSWTPCTAIPSTMSCTDAQISLFAEWPADMVHGDIQTGWMLVVSSNYNNNNKIDVYENGVYQLSFNPIIPNTQAYPSGEAWYGVGYYFNPASTYRFDLCEGTTTGDDMAFVVLDKHSGHLKITDNVVWDIHDGVCQTVNVPTTPNYTGLAQYSGPGVTTSSDGWGTFNPAVAGPGVHTITYTWNNEFGLNPCSGSKSYTVTVTNPYSANITYPKNNYCINETNPNPTITGTTGGTFTAPGGVTINPTTGIINLSGSTPGGPYKILYTVGSLPCGDTASYMITIYPQPAITTNGNTICSGASTTINASGANTYTWSNTMTGSIITVNPTQTITYTVTGTGTGGCTNTATAVVNVNAKPSVTANGATICYGASANITSSGATTYTWSNTMTGSNITINPTLSTTYTVTGTDVNSCTNTATAVVTVNAKPNVTASGNTICNGATTNITASGATTYTWSNTMTGNTITVNPTQTITYTVTGTNGNGCTNTAQATVIVNNKPNITATGGFTCPGSPINVVANNGVNYTWNTGFTGNPLVVTPTADATYTVTGIDANSCTNTAQATVTLNPNISINTTNPAICFGATTVVSAYNGVSYTWNTGAFTSDITVNPSITTTYYVTGANIAGCSGTGQAVVTINPKPNVTATGNTICIGAIANINASGANTYTWSNSETGNAITVNPTLNTTYVVTGTDGNSCTNTAQAVVNVNPKPDLSANGNTICTGAIANINVTGANTYTWSNSQTGSSITVNPTQTTTYTVTGTDGNGCTNTAQAVVNVNPLPTITASGNTICIGAITNINASGANTYTWSNSETGNTITVNPTQTTTYTVTGTDSNGCTNTAQAAVNINPLPNVTATGNTVCIGAIANINASGANTYTWSNSETGNTITVNPTQNTTYSVTGTDGNGCTNTAQAVVNINPLPNVTASGNNICNGASTTIAASGADTYTWSNTMTGSIVTINPTQTTIYTVTGTDSNGCTNVATTVVTVYPKPLITDIPANELCEQGNGSITINMSGGTPGFTYSWSNGSTTKDINGLPEGTYTVTVIDAAGCKDVKTIVINNTNVYPNGNPSVDTIIEFVSHVFLFYWNGIPGSSYKWDFGDGTTSSLINPTHHYILAKKYTVTLTVISAEGCEKEYILYVEVIYPSSIEVFNITTPNHDGFNETYKVKYTGTFTKFSMIIFNRWGMKLYETNDIDAGWDPRNRPDGVYYYIIKAEATDGKNYEFNGYLHVMR